MKLKKYYSFLIYLFLILILALVFILIICIILIHHHNKYLYFEDVKSNEITLGIQTVFILKENILFLREWILYHLEIGFDKIFLYDNTGSIGADSSTSNKNKYDINFSSLVIMSDDEINTEMQQILQDFPNQVYYEKWQPRDSNNNIVYGQSSSIGHYIQKYGHLTTHTAYIDIDEFIYSQNNINIKSLFENEITKIEIKQKKFNDRFCILPNSLIISSSNTITDINTTSWAHKLIIKNDAIDLTDIDDANIHTLPIKYGKTIQITDENILRFNHYNVNEKALNWMKSFYKRDHFQFGTDTSIGDKYSDIILSKCNGKCIEFKSKYLKKHDKCVNFI